MGAVVYLYSIYFVTNIWMLTTSVLLGIIIYTSQIMLFMRERTLVEFEKITQILFKKVL